MQKENITLDAKHKSSEKETSEALSDQNETNSHNFFKPEQNEKSKNVKIDGFDMGQESKETLPFSSQKTDRLTIKQIIKKLFRAILPNEIDDPNEKKRRGLKYKLRQLFLQNPDLDEARYHDIMVADFVYVDPGTPTGNNIKAIRKRGLIEFVAGSVARILQVCACQPFDTVKVKQEAFPHIYRNMVRCIILTYRKDGILQGLYAGTMPAIVASLAQHSILFVAYGSSQAAIVNALEIESTHELSVFGDGCAGSMAAFFSTFAVCPTELVKCRLQSIREMKSYIPINGKVAAKTPYQVTKQIFQNQAKLMDRQQNNESSPHYPKVPSWRWKYFQFLNDTNKRKESLYMQQNSHDDDNQEAVAPKNSDKSEKPKQKDESENREIEAFVSVEETPKDPEGSADRTTETEDKPKKTNIKNKKLFKTIISSETEDVEADDSMRVDDESEKERSSLKYKLRRHFLKTPETNKAKVRDGDDTTPEDFVSIDPKKKTGKAKGNAMKHGLIDFVSGSIGVLQVYVSQPFDTVKVKLQTFPKLYRSMFQCISQTYRKDGIFRGLYAGTIPAVVASVSENSVLFASYGACQSAVATAISIDNVQELSVFGNACAGSLSAFFSTLTLCPTELVKCKLQAIQEMKPFVEKGSKVAAITPFQLSKQIFYDEGIAGFYRGLSSTFVREIPGFFFFFGSYEATREYFTKEGESKDDIGAWKTMLAGSVGGVALWTSTFPADVIKSRIQIKNLKTSMMTVAFDIVKKEGVLALYNGLLPSIIRTIPATATLFLAYEYTKKIMNDNL